MPALSFAPSLPAGRALALALLLHALAVALLGLMAGFFATYSANVNLAMLAVDGATYATVQSAFNRHVRHALFFMCFFGPPPLAALALAAAWRQWRRGWFVLLAIAGLLYLLGIVFFTAQVNLPLNHYTDSWNPSALPDDWALTRARWNAANLWRSWVSLAAFALALGALVWRVASPSSEQAKAAA